ncbi:hypothetical protein AGMMS49928_00160 [Spirochaetia bacterium]|nr:hypothetical protein AGMMS49928_00160 [Spirochaetia bacterium]
MLFSGEKYSPFLLEYQTVAIFLLGIIIFTDSKQIDFSKPLEATAFIIGVICLLVHILLLLIPESVIILFNNDMMKETFQVSSGPRKILSIEIWGVFHKSSPVLILVFGKKFYHFLCNKNIKYFFISIFYFYILSISGTRANLLAVLLVLFIILLYYIFYVKKYITTAVLLFLTGFFLFSVLVYSLITIKDSSSVLKDWYLISYINLFYDNLSIFLLGQGPGSLVEFARNGVGTELSYLELIRTFGIIFAIVIIGIYAYPFIMLLTKRNFFSFSIAISYLAYLFIAGTNPLLTNPTGFTALALAFYFMNHHSAYD